MRAGASPTGATDLPTDTTGRRLVSVVVPSYRSGHTIRACLESLLAQETRFPYEVLVVDSAPMDETAEIVRSSFPRVRLITFSERTEAPLARNRGAEEARGDVLAFLDSDCVAPRDWLQSLVAALETGYEGVGGAIANGNGETLVSWAGYMCEFREFLPGGPSREAAYMTPGNVVYRRSTFLDAGGFPAGCFPLEDQVFNRTLREKGARLRLDPSIVVIHRHRTRRRDFLDHQRTFGRTNAKVLREMDLPGSSLARRRWLAILALPALVTLKFVRTLYACRRVERGLLWRRPRLAWLCWLGLCSWGRGFVEGSPGSPVPATSARSGERPLGLSPETGVSVVVATLDRPTSLRECLGGLIAQASFRPVEVIVVDNNPHSGLTPPIVKEFPGVKLLAEPRRGLSYARNAGVLASRHEIVVTVDDDVSAPPEWLEALVAPLVDADVGIVTGSIVPETLETDAERAFEARGSLASGGEVLEVDRSWFDSFRFKAVPTWTLGTGANTAVRRRLFADPGIGLFDEALGAGTPSGAGEESYLFYRALRCGTRLRYEPRARVRHRHHRTMAALRRRVYEYSKGHVSYHLTTLFRDRDARALLQGLVGQPLDLLRRLVRHSLIDRSYPAHLIAFEILGYLAGPVAFVRSRLRVRRLGRSALPSQPLAQVELDARGPDPSSGRAAHTTSGCR